LITPEKVETKLAQFEEQVKAYSPDEDEDMEEEVAPTAAASSEGEAFEAEVMEAFGDDELMAMIGDLPE
jgi:hypothetical protein